MDQLVTVEKDSDGAVNEVCGDDFLISEGLEVLADYRSIRNDVLRSAVRTFIATIAKSDVEPA